MRKIDKTGIMWMLVITMFIIVTNIGMVSISQNVIEKQLLSQTVSLSETEEIGNDNLERNYPWEVSTAALRKASAEEIRQFQDAGYAGQLEELSLLFGAAVSVNTKMLWVDEEGDLIFKGSEKELSYAVDWEKGMIGFGIEVVSETDDSIKEKNRNDLLVALDDPIHELYQFLPAVNHILGREIHGDLNDREESAGYQDSFDSIRGLQKQVLYYFDVLTVILQTQEGYIILQYNPAEEQFTSYFLVTQ